MSILILPQTCWQRTHTSRTSSCLHICSTSCTPPSHARLQLRKDIGRYVSISLWCDITSHWPYFYLKSEMRVNSRLCVCVCVCVCVFHGYQPFKSRAMAHVIIARGDCEDRDGDIAEALGGGEQGWRPEVLGQCQRVRRGSREVCSALSDTVLSI